ncbi:MAG: type II toxin-antitoxin system RelE/ParE family toxin [Thiotrichales bacterium]|nr:type II toxin-antitoxin system RelE/ParE family toxin [Thiotrichales bacterium]MCY4351455.1 type II toxin-antitoxin system RelE/ParE family toxin [Thiotrichales bacterium]
MTWILVWTRPALRDMKKLDQRLARRIREGVLSLAETGDGDVVKLKGANPPEWRLRVGERRIFFQFQGDAREIRILRVRRRDRAY